MSTNPAKAEAEGIRMATVTWRDLDPFEVPMYREDWPFEAVMATETAQETLVLRALLPPEQFRQFRLSKPTLRDARELSDAIAEAIGLASMGESPASTS